MLLLPPIENYLNRDETIVYRGHRHGMIFLPCILWGIISVFFLTLVPVYQNFAAIALLLTLFYGAHRSIDFFLTEIVVTNRRVLLRMGLIRHLWVETLLENIASFECNQSLVGRLFDYGTLYVYDPGKKGFPITNVAAPIQLRRQIQSGIDRLKKAHDSTAGYK